MKRSQLTIFSATLCLGLAPGRGLTLHEAQELLYRDNPDLAILQLEVEKAKGLVGEARAAWLPSLDALGNYSYATKTSRLELDLPMPGTGGIPIKRDLGDHDKVELGIDASYPLFTGFSRGHNLDARRAQMESQEARWRGAQNQMSLRLAALFYAWQHSQLQADYQKKVLEHSREYQRQLEDFVRAGTAVRSRALTAEARSRAAEVDLLAAENTRDSLAFEVLDFLGRRDPAGLGSPGDLAPDTARMPRPDWEEPPTPVSQRPEREALDWAMTQARLGGKVLAGQKLPQLYGLVGYRYANPGLNLTESEFMHYGLLGLQLRWNLFDGSRNRAQRKQLEIQGRIIGEQKRKLEGEWWKSMQSSRLQYMRWEAQFAAAQASREAARASASDLKRQMDVGLSTGLDWLEARNNAARAELMMEQARTMQRLSLLQWRYAAGKELRF